MFLTALTDCVAQVMHRLNWLHMVENKDMNPSYMGTASWDELNAAIFLAFGKKPQSTLDTPDPHLPNKIVYLFVSLNLT